TDVLVRAAGEVGPAAPGPGWSGHTHVADEPDDAWLRAFLGVKNGVDHADVARAVLTGAPAQYLTATSGGETVGTLRVAFAEQWAALSCLAVSPDARRHGLGRTLTRHGLALAARHGASRVFLQVEAANAAAAALYAQLGFVVADGYAYLVREDG
ncbi:MAG: GNAT family N-acetyltransferase, partial [Cellulomonas sp.]|nr:GNAT family N-acetyltransferase [Cellulomonas sp.]